MALLVLLQFVVTALSVRSEATRRLVRSDPTLVLLRGEFLYPAMRSQRLTESEILQAARAQGIADLSAHAVVLETDGSLSVLPAAATGKPQPSAFADLRQDGNVTPA